MLRYGVSFSETIGTDSGYESQDYYPGLADRALIRNAGVKNTSEINEIAERIYCDATIPICTLIYSADLIDVANKSES